MKVKLVVYKSVLNYDYYMENGYKHGDKVSVKFMGKDFRSGNLYMFKDAPFFLSPDIDFQLI